MTEMTIIPYYEDDLLTPKEIRLEHVGKWLAYGAVAYGAITLLLMLLGIVAAINSPNVFDALKNILLSRFAGASDVALLITILLTVGNICAVVWVMVGVVAHEVWSPLAILAWLGFNIGLMVSLGYTPALVAIGMSVYVMLLLRRDLRAFRINPLMLKELRERMRGARAFVVLSVYLALMSGFAILLYLIERNNSPVTLTSVTGELGRRLFGGIVGLELLLIMFIAPAFTAGAISNERERKTYDLLHITLLPKPSFIIGKLQSALSYIFLLLLSAIPLQSIAFLFGGVTEVEVAIAFVILMVMAIAFSTVGLYFSTTVERTVTASLRAYTLAFVMTVGLWFGLNMIVRLLTELFSGANATVIAQGVLIYLQAIADGFNPIMTALQTQQLLVNQQGVFFYEVILRDSSILPVVAPWLIFTAIYMMLSSVMVVLAVRRMRRVEA
ncbi:MAG: hypothetical protein CUN52_07655 [Phototrophicales bacterium]|nr:MAG: hypothetical protein CUN52_07655 [Phototrophicales bacterium]